MYCPDLALQEDVPGWRQQTQLFFEKGLRFLRIHSLPEVDRIWCLCGSCYAIGFYILKGDFRPRRAFVNDAFLGSEISDCSKFDFPMNDPKIPVTWPPRRSAETRESNLTFQSQPFEGLLSLNLYSPSSLIFL